MTFTLTEKQATDVACVLGAHGYESGWAAVRDADGRVVPDAFTVDYVRPFPEGD